MKERETKERWVPAKFIRPDGSVLDFTELYEVSDHGRVRSLRSYGHAGKTKVRSQSTNNKPDVAMYYQVQLYLNNRRYLLAVHRLVLSSFKESEYFPGAIVDHIVARTSTSCDNRLSNLRWFTYQQNNSTEHCRETRSKAFTNRKDLSKRVRVTDLTTGKTTVYPSANEAGRALGINPKLPAIYINQLNGYYKKLGLHFEYV